MLDIFRDIDVIKTIRGLVERVTMLEGSFGGVNLTISGGDFSSTIHDIDLDGGEF